MKKGFTTFMKTECGFTLVELLVVIVILAILAVVGMTSFSKVTANARDGKRRGDVDAISKAFEANYDAQRRVYRTLTAADFTGGAIPTTPEGGSYQLATITPGSSGTYKGYRVCTQLESHPAGTACTRTSSTCYCRDSALGVPVAATPPFSDLTPTTPTTTTPSTTTPTPASVFTPTPAPTPAPTSAPTSAPTPAPTSSPAPTASPSPTSAPTPAPTSVSTAVCADGTNDQVYSTSMVGCNGAVNWTNKSARCAAGSHVCSFAEYAARGGKTTKSTRVRWLSDMSSNFSGDTPSCSSAFCGGGGCRLFRPGGFTGLLAFNLALYAYASSCATISADNVGYIWAGNVTEYDAQGTTCCN